ncbi:hypothetical protein [Ferruginibacter sp.]
MLLCFCTGLFAIAGTRYNTNDPATSTAQQAVAFIDSFKNLEPSAYWPNVRPAAFLQNIKENVEHPLVIYAGNGTNFCGYGALSYLLLQDDPLGYAKVMLQLYRDGRAHFGNSDFDPSEPVKKQAGRMRFKGMLDIHPADQLWFLTLADHFKGYLNFFNRKYDPGDEDRFWASVNYAKFNRMVRSLLHFKVHPRGTDLIRPSISDLYDYISTRLQSGKVVLYINNRIVHKKKHEKIKLKVPTHFIVAEKIYRQDDLITLVYWDYGGKTLMQLTPKFLKRIVFGITHFTKN